MGQDLPLPGRHLVFYGAAAGLRYSVADPLPIVIFIYLCAILLLLWTRSGSELLAID
jgi:hypothetical protein